MKFKNSELKIQEIIDKNFFTGAVMEVWKDKQKIYSNSFGIDDIDSSAPMTEDKIFKAYSMSKPLTVLGFLKLVDKKLVDVNDLVSKYLPEYAELNVLDDVTSKTFSKASNQLTIFNLLTMTSGITYHGNKNETQILTGELLQSWSKQKNNNLRSFAKELSKIPLLFEPGTNWNYGLSIDIIGAIIEVISSKSLEQYMHDEIFEPLKMSDTGFMCFDKERLAKVYMWTFKEDGNVLKKASDNFHPFVENEFELSKTLFAGAGIYTTASDYSKFLNVLLDGKIIEGQVFISENLISEMRSEQLRELREYFNWNLNEDYSYGYGVRVRTKNISYPITVEGEFGWDGMLGSTGLVDPINKLTMTLMVSSFPGHNKLIETEFFESFYKDVLEK